MDSNAAGLLPVLILLASSVIAVAVCRSARLPPMIGYLLTGLALGPHALGVVSEREETHRLAEFGVVFLMFSIGLEFSLAKLKAMHRLVFGLGSAQVGATIAIAVAAAVALGGSWQAGLALDNGVLVDEYLETSRAGVFAAGDIASWPDLRTGRRLRVEHWVVAERQGQAAARNMLGERLQYDDVPFFWTWHHDAALNYVGHHAPSARVTITGNLANRDARVTYREGEKVSAVATIGRDRESLLAELALERGTA